MPSKNGHSEECRANNGIKTKNGLHSDQDREVEIEDNQADFKKRCAELALERIWLQPLKVWEIVRDEIVTKCKQGVVVPLSEQVSLDFGSMHTYVSWYICNRCSYHKTVCDTD